MFANRRRAAPVSGQSATNARFDLLFASDIEGGIGKNNSIPWDLPADRKYFRDETITTSDPALKNAVIMGKNTWLSLPDKYRPLPNRLNIVLTSRNELVLPEGAFACTSLDEALEYISTRQVDRIFVIGGAYVFKQALKHERCGLLYLTEIMQNFHCDVFLPDFKQDFTLVSSSELMHENGIDYRFTVYQRNSDA
jgi:dihydrofolate reductase